MQDLNVSLIQSDLHWSDPDKNKRVLGEKINSLQQSTDLIILPEMFTTGFTMEASSFAEEMDGKTMEWMAYQADKSGAVVTGSIIIKENDNFFNRLIWMYPGGMYQVYDKRHLFAMAGEDQHYKSGDERLIVKINEWRICPMVCYDLRFPVWSRNKDDFDVLVYLANWPDTRSYDWNTLLKARAIENQCYVIGVNRVGEDPNGHSYNGDSCVIDPGWNKTIFHHEKEEICHTSTLSFDHLQKVRSSLPFLQDKDSFVIM